MECGVNSLNVGPISRWNRGPGKILSGSIDMPYSCMLTLAGPWPKDRKSTQKADSGSLRWVLGEGAEIEPGPCNKPMDPQA